MPKHNLAALKELKRVVGNIPPDKLDLRTYGTSMHNRSDTADLATWAARDDWFKQRGFAMQDYPVGSPDGNNRTRTYPLCTGKVAEHATKAFFGLTTDENEYLFGSYEDDPHPLVAVLIDRIETVIKGEKESG